MQFDTAGVYDPTDLNLFPFVSFSNNNLFVVPCLRVILVVCPFPRICNDVSIFINILLGEVTFNTPLHHQYDIAIVGKLVGCGDLFIIVGHIN